MTAVDGKIALVTGAGNGIGRALSGALLARGCTVYMTDIRQADLDSAREEFAAHGDRLETVVLDVSDRNAVIALAEQIRAAHGRLHLLFNNAGINHFGPMDEATFDDWDWIMGVNFHGVINGVVAFMPLIKAAADEGAHIINTASMAAFVPGVGAGVYSAAKFGVRGLTEAMWYALAPKGIGMSMVCPGLVSTNIHNSDEIRPPDLDDASFSSTPEFLERMAQVHSLGMPPAEMARRIIEGVEANRLRIFTHPDHREEVEELHAEVMASFPDEDPEPTRYGFEQIRRRGNAEARAAGLKALAGENAND